MSLRVNALYTEHQLKIYMQTDRLFGLLLVFQWLLCIGLALFVTPKTWIGQTSSVHFHVWIAVILGAVLNLYPLYLIARHSGKSITRYAIATAQMLTGALLIHLTGGKIETHFHIFGSLAFLAFYRDWKVLALATAIVVFDHLFRGLFWSQSVFGVGDTDPWRWLEHAIWVAFEDVFLFYACHKSKQEMKEIAEKQAALESTKTTIEEMVTLRTRELSEALHQQEALIQNIPDSVWLKDASLRYILVNPTFLEISKLRPKDILGKTDAELWSPETAQKIYETDQKILTSGKTLHYEESFVNGAGEPVWFDTSQAPIKNDHNAIIGIVGLSRDITNRKLHETQMNEANQNLSIAYDEIAKQLEVKTQMEKKLLQAQKMEAIGTLTGGIAHDFNNILWMIMGNSEMLLDELKEQPELLEIQQDIFNAADRAKGLVQQLLDFSRQRSDSDNFQPVMVAPLVKEVSKMVQYAAVQHRIEIELVRNRENRPGRPHQNPSDSHEPLHQCLPGDG
jgi:two-component system, sensor histidine kinase and response regulator